jgi:hypothetical protein
MKYSCNYCNDQTGPCIVDVQCVDPEPPYSCIYANDESDMEAEWKPIEGNKKDFEINGLCSNCSNCGENCDNCKDASGFSNDARLQHDAPLMSDNLRSEIDAANARLKAKIKDKDYRQESVVSKNKIKIEEMINAHWSYIESVIRTSNEYGLYMPPMSLDDALKIREFDYKTAAKHFYGHGHEDGVIDMANTTVERLRK